MKHYKLLLVFFLVFCIRNTVFSQENAEPTKQTERYELRMDFPLLDFPFQIHTMDAMGYGFFNTYTSLSMNQSLALTANIYSAIHYGARQLSKLNGGQYENGALVAVTVGGLTAFSYNLPFGGHPWLSREFARSILSRHGVPSENGEMNIFSSNFVSGFTDNELSHLKETAPYDFIRAHVGGIEASLLLSDKIQRGYFFHNTDSLSWISALLASVYSIGPAITFFLDDAASMNKSIATTYKDEEGSDQRERDLAFHQTVSWVYELFRPHEAYDARGKHPSGDGSVARYITIDQLTDDEKNYLSKQAYLSMLNFVSPMTIGIRSISLGASGWEGNFALRHFLTSFGSDISATVFLQNKPLNMVFTLHNYQNYESYFPALEAELIDFPVSFGRNEFFLSPRVMVGVQPKGQEFKTSSVEFFGLFGLNLSYKVTQNIFPYINATAKTDGWVAGNEYLSSNVSIQIGSSIRF